MQLFSKEPPPPTPPPPGPTTHPAYLHALSDLRMARALIRDAVRWSREAIADRRR